MSAAVQLAFKHRPVRTLTAFPINVEAELNGLHALYSALGLEGGTLFTPAFFLASVAPETWRPVIVAVQDETRSPIGLLYAKERKLLGRATGLFFADATLGSLVISRSADRQQAFWVGMRTLLNSGRVRGLRVLAPPSGHEAAMLKAIAKQTGYECRRTPTESHVTLPLTETYERFLEALSSKTRRNFRYYRNRSENAGHEYVQNLNLEEFSTAAWKLEAEEPTGGNSSGLRRALKMFAAAEKPLLIGLRSATGDLISLVGGWYENGRVVIFMQLNSDKRHARFSLSLVVRAHLIESLIEQRYREIVWWAGVGEPLSRYCTPVPSTWVYLDSPTFAWRTLRALIDRHRNWVPARFRFVAEWLVPPCGKSPILSEPE